jgi:hypothetical protein
MTTGIAIKARMALKLHSLIKHGESAMKGLKNFAFTTLLIGTLTLAGCEVSRESFLTDNYNKTRDYVGANMPGGGGTDSSDKLLNKNGCPEVDIVDDLSSFYDFGAANPGEGNLVTSVQMSQGATNCAFGPKSVTVDTRIVFSGRIGPKGAAQGGGAPNFTYPYFVAIMAPGGKILAKEVFAVPMTYAAGDIQQHIEAFRQIIPSYSQESAGKHKIAIGFQLTKEQLAYNRELLRQRQEAEKVRAEEQKKLLKQQQQKTITTAPDGTVIESTTTAVPIMGGDPLATGPIIIAPPDQQQKTLNQSAIND